MSKQKVKQEELEKNRREGRINAAINILPSEERKLFMLFLKKEGWEGEENKFHIIPKSRGGNGGEENTCRISKYIHYLYHELTDIKGEGSMARTPDEVLVFLVKELWNNQGKWLMIALNELEDED